VENVQMASPHFNQKRPLAYIIEAQQEKKMNHVLKKQKEYFVANLRVKKQKGKASL
jgi:hypothetical protein